MNFAAVLVLLSAMAWAVENERPIVVERTVQAGQAENLLLALPAKCDSDGAIYLRFFRNGMAPITKIFPDGKKLVSLEYRSKDADLAKAGEATFAISAVGVPYSVAVTRKDVFVVSFSKDGEYRGKIKLDRYFFPTHLAVMGQGESFLISGVEAGHEKEAPVPFTAIFDGNGRFVKEVAVDAANKSHASTKSADPEISAKENEAVRNSISLGSALTSPDGRVYLMRAGSPAIVFSIDLDGSISRKIFVEPPLDGSAPSELQANGSFFALSFTQFNVPNPKSSIAVFDSVTGNKIATYSVPVGVGGAFACYLPDGSAAFLGVENKQIVIRWARLR